MNPSATPSFTIHLGREIRTLKYGFRAFKALNLNPFRPAELFAFLGSDSAGRLNFESMDVDRAAQWIRAGLLWAYAKDQACYGQPLPEVEEIIDLLDMPTFMQTFGLSLVAAGLKKSGPAEPNAPDAPEAPPEPDPDPPQA